MNSNQHINNDFQPKTEDPNIVQHSFIIGMVCMLLSIGLIWADNWLGVFWLLIPVGAVLSALFWQKRHYNSWGNGLCFSGVLLLLYGVIAELFVVIT